MDNQTQDQKWEEAAFLEKLNSGIPAENIFINPEKYRLTNYSRRLAAPYVVDNIDKREAQKLDRWENPDGDILVPYRPNVAAIIQELMNERKAAK